MTEALKGKKILIVDDEIDALDLMEELFLNCLIEILLP